jgi:hypothetical protein
MFYTMRGSPRPFLTSGGGGHFTVFTKVLSYYHTKVGITKVKTIKTIFRLIDVRLVELVPLKKSLKSLSRHSLTSACPIKFTPIIFFQLFQFGKNSDFQNFKSENLKVWNEVSMTWHNVVHKFKSFCLYFIVFSKKVKGYTNS